ncbi:hypothetical protein ACIBCD_28285 [Nocardia brasiliensis]|uniref:hypothetical protein n=1 Tax=Nocardia brasiliensis TaxID=37326 RepID=UPI00378B7534
MTDNAVDDVARSWAQLFRLMMQLRQQARLLGGNTVKLSRAEHRELARQIEQTVLIHQYAHDTSREWLGARLHDYQREAAAVRARIEKGVSPEQHERMTGYLSGLRTSIEHTVHQTPLTAEERGQTIATLAAVDADPREPIARNVFQNLSKTEAARARLTAANSEYRLMRHREELTATPEHGDRSPNQIADAETVEWRERNTQLLGTLDTRIAALEKTVNTWQARKTLTATAQPNGHAPAREKQHAEQAMPAASGPSPKQAEQQAETATHPEPQADSQASLIDEEQLIAEMPPEWVAEMEAQA